MDTTIGISLALLSALSWAIGSTLYKQLGGDISAFALNLMSSALGLVLLAGVVLVSGSVSVSPSELWILGASGVLGITLGDTFFFAALRDLGAHAVVVLSMLAPALTVLLAVALLGESPNRQAWYGIALVIAGVATVLLAQTARSDGTRRRGILFGLAAVVTMALGTVVAKKGLETVAALDATVVRVGFGTAGLIAVGVARRSLIAEVAACLRPRLLARLLVAVAVITLGGFWALHASLKYVDLSVAASVHATEPLFVLPLAAIFLGEAVTVPAIVGTLLAVGGIALLFTA